MNGLWDAPWKGFPTWQVQPNVADEHLGWTRGDRLKPRICVFYSSFCGFCQFRWLSQGTQISKNLGVHREAIGSFKEFSGFQHEMCHQSWIQTVDEHNGHWNIYLLFLVGHLKLISENSTSSKRNFSHLTCLWNTIPILIPKCQEKHPRWSDQAWEMIWLD